MVFWPWYPRPPKKHLAKKPLRDPFDVMSKPLSPSDNYFGPHLYAQLREGPEKLQCSHKGVQKTSRTGILKRKKGPPKRQQNAKQIPTNAYSMKSQDMKEASMKLSIGTLKQKAASVERE